MLKRLSIAIVVLIAALALIDFVSSSFVPRPCLIEKIVSSGSKQEPKENDKQNTCAYRGGLVVEGISFVTEWKPEVWTAIGTLVIAVFTTILGLFTVSLAKSTRLAAEAADLSARAAVGVDLPIIRISPHLMVFEGPKNDEAAVHFVLVRNKGRSSAFPIQIDYGWYVGAALPSEPVYPFTEPADINEIFKPQTSSDAIADRVYLRERQSMGADSLERVLNKEWRVWFFCRLVYRDAVIRELREAGFCWEWAGHLGGRQLKPDPTPAYNRQT